MHSRPGWIGPVLSLALMAGSIGMAYPASGQGTAGVSSDSVAVGCPVVPKPVPPSETQRRSARDLAARAQEAAIVDDNATARDLYERAAKLDPTDPTTAYALARAYEAARDPRALTEYCRFLTLSPNSTAAADVRQRVASLSAELAQRNTQASAAVAAPVGPAQSAGTAFALGLLFPGFGQYYTHRPGIGIVFTAAAAGALFYALQTRAVVTETTQTATDPNGKQYQYQVATTHNEHPNAAAGVAIAATISLVGAVEAYLRARSAGVDDTSSADARIGAAREPRVAAVVTPIGRGIGLGMRVPLALQP